MTPGGERGLAIGAVALGAAAALLGSLSTRSSTATGTSGLPVGGSGSTGDSAGTTALALVVLAGAGAVLLVGRRAKRLLGGVLVLVAGGLVAVASSPVHVVPVVGGLVSVLGALAIVVRAGVWPPPRSRYDAPVARAASAPKDTWDALDRGEDPTA